MTIPDTMDAINKLEELLRRLLHHACTEYPGEGYDEIYLGALKWCIEARVRVLELFRPVDLAPAQPATSSPATIATA